ncbi:putative LRR receptor-like serine/threonine-protein kinase [Nymphaea thermarum]|nr:putative LRR receptor-like serine/threonine-protein kinase [Nymphaea thermarum]
MAPQNLLILSLCCFLFSILFPAASSAPSCNSSDYHMAKSAFRSLMGFHPATFLNCSATIRELNLSSKGLQGTVSWANIAKLGHLRTLDLSNNSIQGSLPGSFWYTTKLLHLNLAGNQLGGCIGFRSADPSGRVPTLQTLILSNNRFTGCISLLPFRNLRILDVSGNRITNNSVLVQAFDLGRLEFLSASGNGIGSIPSQLNNSSRIVHLDVSNCSLSGSLRPISFLPSLSYLDVSRNRLSGSFPSDFPPIRNLRFMNISFNRFTGTLGDDTAHRFGSSAFIDSGLTAVRAPVPHPVLPKTGPSPLKWNHTKAVIISVSASAAACILVVAILLICLYRRRKKKPKMEWAVSKTPIPVKINELGPFSFQTDTCTWVADIKEPTSAAVVIFEKPLLSLTFADLLGATTRFSRESQLAESRSGPVYRAVLAGDIHVAIKVLELARDTEVEEAVAKLEALGRLKHPNILPLLGYCIAGKEKLLLYEFMANGNLHQWLHELPTGATNVEDWSTDTWEQQPGSAERAGWITRHRIALGIARGLACLHHAGARPVIHGRLTLSNILLDDDLEPRISDFGFGDIIGHESHDQPQSSARGSDPESPESDVYSYGVVLLELMTGRAGSEEMVGWVRRLVREKQGEKAIDPRLKPSGSDTGMVECLRVGYLCTAESSEKRPTMQQVVGLLKDIN